ncbi:YbjQ family protein [Candidatus Bipolaricaulota bacterium]|nr:YbjQ family protein [Candidatus Bipolaricaulota bacterium]
MLITTTEEVPGYEIIEILGLVRGNTVRARHLGRDVLAGLRNVVGGEITEYTEMLSKAREEAVQRMISQAEELGADAVVGVRFATSQTMAGAAEILVYGTAVKLRRLGRG